MAQLSKSLHTLRDSGLRGNLAQATCAHRARAGAAHRLNGANAGLASTLGEVYIPVRESSKSV